jgi:predicted kinase
MREERTKMYFMCGKMAAGESAYARELAQTKNAVLLIQDEFLRA